MAFQRDSKVTLTMNPMKNTATTDARINARRRLFFFCSGSWRAPQPITPELRSHQAWAGFSNVWNGAGRRHFPFQAFGGRPMAFVGALAPRRAHGRQHHKQEEVNLPKPNRAPPMRWH